MRGDLVNYRNYFTTTELQLLYYRLIEWGTGLCVGIFFVNYRNYFTTTELLYDYFTSGSSGGALVYAWGSRV